MGLLNTEQRDPVCPLPLGAEELVVWKGGKVNSKAFIAGKLGRAMLLFCMQYPQGDQLPLNACSSWRNFILMPVSWDLELSQYSSMPTLLMDTAVSTVNHPQLTCPSLA